MSAKAAAPAVDLKEVSRLLATVAANVNATKSAPHASELVTADLVLQVTRFRNVFDPADWAQNGPPLERMLTEHRLLMPVEYYPSVYRKRSGLPALGGREVTRISAAGAILRFTINAHQEREDEEKPENSHSYHPVGVAFGRAEERFEPRAVLLASALRPHASPYSDLKITPAGFQVRVTPLHGLRGADGAWASHITYKYWIFIQRARDGALGVIDPYDEHDNPP